jgi:hypothetical protein
MPRTYVRRPGERVRRDPSRAKVYVPKWVDPYWWIQGSRPEKMVMAEFVRRGIYFEHTPQTNSLPWLDWMFIGQNPRNWEADYLLPQYKIWIEVQGSYFHTLPGQIEKDALRFTFIKEIGWKPIFWWDYDIESRLQDLMNAVPEFYNVNQQLEAKVQATYRKTEGLPFYEGGIGIDHLAGLRQALRNRGRPPQFQSQRYRRRRNSRLRRPK